MERKIVGYVGEEAGFSTKFEDGKIRIYLLNQKTKTKRHIGYLNSTGSREEFINTLHGMNKSVLFPVITGEEK